MPLQIVNGVTVVTNYTFSNCQTSIGTAGNIILHNVSFSAINASGILCSITANFPWFWTAFLMTVYVVFLFLFSYLNSVKLLVVANSGLFIIATILLGYGFINGIVWIGTLGMLIFAAVLMYLSHRG